MRPHACRAKTTGEGAGWIGGVPGRNDVVQTWLCQPGGNTPCPSITDATTCPADQLKASLQCPDPSCNAKAVGHHLHLMCPVMLVINLLRSPSFRVAGRYSSCLCLLRLWQPFHSASQRCTQSIPPGPDEKCLCSKMWMERLLSLTSTPCSLRRWSTMPRTAALNARRHPAVTHGPSATAQTDAPATARAMLPRESLIVAAVMHNLTEFVVPSIPRH